MASQDTFIGDIKASMDLPPNNASIHEDHNTNMYHDHKVQVS